ncbi:MAG TPA: threonylcarbamoyl-AMP synthase [Firmicutes bacterium]|nr:threonylcarbamoyl-AMP synthase [Bacillota bacterium]
MRTELLRVEPARPDQAALQWAGEVLRQGGLVAFPTETVYGLGADALNPRAVRRIFAAKGRPADNPLIVHVAEREMLQGLVSGIPAVGRALMDRFWPGPLTLVLPKGERVPDEVTAGLPSVGIRMPDHDVALGLIAAAGVPVAAPSANRSGRPSPTTAAHVWEDLQGRVEIILDGGPTGVGVESTVVDVTGSVPVLLRPGGLPVEEIELVAGRVAVDPALQGKKVDRPRAPGMKYTHYAPRAPLTLVAPGPGSGPAEVAAAAWRTVRELVAEGPSVPVGLLALAENLSRHRQTAAAAGLPFTCCDLAQEPPLQAPPPPAAGILALEAGPWAQPSRMAVRLFAALRWFDAAGVKAIVAEGIAPSGLGFAVMNRLRKAASVVMEA